MADRSALSDADTGLTGRLSAIRWTGIRVGDVMSSTVPWAKANPVIAPHVLRLTSAVACCHVGFLTGCTRITFFRVPARIAGPVGAGGLPFPPLARAVQALEDRPHPRLANGVSVPQPHAPVVRLRGRRPDHPLLLDVGPQPPPPPA